MSQSIYLQLSILVETLVVLSRLKSRHIVDIIDSCIDGYLKKPVMFVSGLQSGFCIAMSAIMPLVDFEPLLSDLPPE